MRLTKLTMFMAEASRILSTRPGATAVCHYRVHGDGWRLGDSEVAAPAAIVADLDRARAEPSRCYRAPAAKTSFYWVPSLSAVVLYETSTSLRSERQRQTLSLLSEALDRSANQFAAEYDGLTGLANRESFDGKLRLALASYISAGASLQRDASAADAAGAPPNAVALIALDIDHFKQVNDHFGHQYGDFVLQGLAINLTGFVAKSGEILPSGTVAEAARPSGEEFLVMIAGPVTKSHLNAFCEKLLQGVRDAVIPDDEALAAPANSALVSSIGPLPPPHRRKLTISAGVATAEASLDTRPELALRALRESADRALYRAKSSGRDCFRFFDEIRHRHGTVLEHHVGTGVVAIDIGSSVGVRPGHEFLVFHPQFSGEKPFELDTGRSVRRLGMYPRHSTGRIVVFDVQEEISFATADHAVSVLPFAANSGLEAVGLGTYEHLLQRSHLTSRGGLMSGEQFGSIIREAGDMKSTVAIAVCGIHDVDALVEKEGLACANEGLAALHDALRSRFPAPTPMTAVAVTEIALIVREKESIDALSVSLRGAIEDASRKLQSVVSYDCGYFRTDEIPVLSGKSVPVPVSRGLEVASLAKAMAGDAGNLVSEFSLPALNQYLYQLRRTGRVAKAAAAAQFVDELGLLDCNIANQWALALWETASGPVDVPVGILRRAIGTEVLNLSNAIIAGNLGLMLYDAGDYGGAIEQFSRVESVSGFVLPDGYHVVHAASHAVRAEQLDREGKEAGPFWAQAIRLFVVAEPMLSKCLLPKAQRDFMRLMPVVRAIGPAA